jgi:RNA polymerase sigma factor (sigma-70 family)
MTTTPANIVLRHLRQIIPTPGDSRTDGQLLERFGGGHDDAAFAALVRRHGPMVMGVCRRALHNEQDAEDAFQATFLVLARKARSVGREGSVSGWLFRVAYHTAVRVRSQGATRRLHEAQAPRRSAEDPLADVTARELLLALDEELQALLPQWRSPLVLCFLQRQTRDQAARALGCSVRTVKRRLAEGQERLRCRLERRGLSLPAALLVAGIAPGAARAALPAPLADATVNAALATLRGEAAAVSAPVAELTRQTLRSLSVPRLKLACGLMLGIGLVVLGVSALALPTTPAPPSEASLAEPPPAPPDEKKAAADEDKKMTVNGRVVDPDGKPVPGAAVAVIATHYPAPRTPGLNRPEQEVLGQGKADAEGAFKMVVPRTSSARYRFVTALASAPGFGLGWLMLNPDAEKPEAVVALRPEQVIRGRVLDIQGQPAGGVSVSAVRLFDPGAKEPSAFNFEALERLPLWPAPVKTDRDGRFSLTGLGRSLKVTLQFDGEGVAPKEIGTDNDGEEVGLALAPGQTIEGKVTCADTGKPAAGARLMVNVGSQPGPYRSHSTRTDAEGRYRLSTGSGNQVVVWAYPAEGEPYLAVEKRHEWAKGKVRETVNVELPRGVLVRGRVTEAGTGTPVVGATVSYRPRNPRPGVLTGRENLASSGPDGTFALAVVPGPGHLLVQGPTPDYVHQEVGSAEIEAGRPGGTRLYPDALAALDLARDAQPEEVKLTLKRGVTVTGRLVDPDGQPLSKGMGMMVCRSNVSPWDHRFHEPTAPMLDGRFELHGLDSEKTYPVHFLDLMRQLGATVEVSGKQAKDGPLTIKLGRCGSARVKVLDLEGNPAPKRRPMVLMVVTPGPGDFTPDARGKLRADTMTAVLGDWTSLLLDGPRTDAEGRVKLTGLIPGATYRLLGLEGVPGFAEVDFKVEAGETKDLPDVTLKKME